MGGGRGGGAEEEEGEWRRWRRRRKQEDQKEAAEMDGAGALSIFWYITLPHMSRAITVVILIFVAAS